LSGNHIGTYLGLFNCTICIPQIIAALLGGFILKMFPLTEAGVTNTAWMLFCSGILLLLGAIAVWNIKETFGSKPAEEA
jgi:maltose/moltooligosaccharide transporter